MVLVGCTTATSPTQTKAVPQRDPKDDWFIVSWEAPTDLELLARDGVATMRHHGNVYKARCLNSYMMLKDPDIPQQLRHKDRPCGSLIREYVGHTIPGTSLQNFEGNPPVDASGWFAVMWLDTKGHLDLQKDSFYPANGEWFKETFETVSVEKLPPLSPKD